MIPIEFIEYANIKLDKNIITFANIISVLFAGIISPYPTVVMVIAAQ
jgi:hypothetical protein